MREGVGELALGGASETSKTRSDTIQEGKMLPAVCHEAAELERERAGFDDMGERTGDFA